MSCETREQSSKEKHRGRERQLGARNKRAVNDTGAILMVEVHYTLRQNCEVQNAIAMARCKTPVRDLEV